MSAIDMDALRQKVAAAAAAAGRTPDQPRSYPIPEPAPDSEAPPQPDAAPAAPAAAAAEPTPPPVASAPPVVAPAPPAPAPAQRVAALPAQVAQQRAAQGLPTSPPTQTPAAPPQGNVQGGRDKTLEELLAEHVKRAEQRAAGRKAKLELAHLKIAADELEAEEADEHSRRLVQRALEIGGSSVPPATAGTTAPPPVAGNGSGATGDPPDDPTQALPTTPVVMPTTIGELVDLIDERAGAIAAKAVEPVTERVVGLEDWATGLRFGAYKLSVVGDPPAPGRRARMGRRLPLHAGQAAAQ